MINRLRSELRFFTKAGNKYRCIFVKRVLAFHGECGILALMYRMHQTKGKDG